MDIAPFARDRLELQILSEKEEKIGRQLKQSTQTQQSKNLNSALTKITIEEIPIATKNVREDEIMFFFNFFNQDGDL